MANTYSGDPASSDKDWVRFQIGDTAAPWRFTDEEINAAIAEHGSKELAAAALIQIRAIQLANEPDFRIGRFSESYRSAIQSLNEKAKELRAQANFGFYVGGVSAADKAAHEADTDRVKPAFRRGMMEP